MYFADADAAAFVYVDIVERCCDNETDIHALRSVGGGCAPAQNYYTLPPGPSQRVRCADAAPW